MPKLFEIIPLSLFRPLAAPGASVYAEALLTLFAATKRHHQPLSRELAVTLIAELLADPEALAITDELDEPEESESADAPDELARIQSRSSALLRALVRYGWLRMETQSDFSQQCILPDHAFRLLQVLELFINNEPPRLRGVIAAVRDLLQAAANNEGDEPDRILQAQRQTQVLISGLKELQHNIGAHLEKVLQQMDANHVLDQFFTRYREEIVDRAYHQLRTTDHVGRFRLHILEAITQLETETRLRAAARRMRMSGDAADFESAEAELRECLREIRESFEALDDRLHALDVRHSQFVSSAVRAVELQLTANTTTSGQLHAILQHLLKEAAPLSDERLLNLFALNWLDAKSLAPAARAGAPFVAETQTVATLSDSDIAAAQRQTMRDLARAVSRNRVRRWAEELLCDCDERRGSEIPLAGPEDLPLLIYLRSYGDGSLGYETTDVPDAVWIERDGVGFRDFVLRKVE
jgi:hypothetical protein